MTYSAFRLYIFCQYVYQYILEYFMLPRDQKCRWAEGRYQRNLGFHTTSAVPQTDHHWIYCIVHWIYLIHEFHNLSWITEINELFHDIRIYWDAPVFEFSSSVVLVVSAWYLVNTNVFPGGLINQIRDRERSACIRYSASKWTGRWVWVQVTELTTLLMLGYRFAVI